MRRLAAAILLLATCAAGAQQVDRVVPFRSASGLWEFGCHKGKLVAVRIIFIVPGEILLQVPPDLCTRPLSKQQQQPAPAVPPSPAASAPNAEWRPA